MGKHERKRVTREQVRENAKRGDRGPRLLTLPDGVEEWYPKEAGKVKMDVLPYLVEEKTHPDDGIEKNTVWYKRTMRVHHGIGPNNYSYVCPACIGLPCPIHEDRAKLMKKGGDGEEFEKLMKSLDGQQFILFNMRDPENEEKIRVFCYSAGKFWSFKGGGLKKELESDDDILLFWDVRKKRGRTMEVRFSEETFMKSKYLQATRFTFEERDNMDEDAILERTVELSGCLNVLDYKKLKDLYEQSAGEDGSDDKEKTTKKNKKEKASSSKKKSSAASSGSGSGSKDSEKSGSGSDSSDSEEKTTKKPAKGGKKSGKKSAGSGASSDSSTSDSDSDSESSSGSDSSED